VLSLLAELTEMHHCFRRLSGKKRLAVVLLLIRLLSVPG
jgi:hypothetical protein